MWMVPHHRQCPPRQDADDTRIEQRIPASTESAKPSPSKRRPYSCPHTKEIFPIMAVPASTDHPAQTLLVVALCAAASVSVSPHPQPPRLEGRSKSRQRPSHGRQRLRRDPRSGPLPARRTRAVEPCDHGSSSRATFVIPFGRISAALHHRRPPRNHRGNRHRVVCP